MRFKEFCITCQSTISDLADCPLESKCEIFFNCERDYSCKECMENYNEIITNENCYNVADYICSDCLVKLLFKKEKKDE